MKAITNETEIKAGDQGNSQNSPGMAAAKPHPVLAGFFDLYIYLTLLATIDAVIGTSTGRFFILRSQGGSIAGYTLTLLGVVIYHGLIARRIRRLSPGERIAGRKVTDGQKTWVNPYPGSRWGLFLLSAVTVLLIGRQWEGISAGNSYSIWWVVGRAVVIYFQIYGLTQIGRGRLRGLFFILLPLLIGVVGTDSGRSGGLLLPLTQLLLFSGIGLYYLFRKRSAARAREDTW